MTVFTAAVSIDMGQWDLDDIANGLAVVGTPTLWTVTGANLLNTYSFTGKHLTYDGLIDPQPTGGTINGFSALENGVLTFTVSGAIAAADLAAFIAADDLAGLQKAWFSGDDTITGSAWSDDLLGYDGNDEFNLAAGGSDTAEGGKGDDTFLMAGAMDATDTVDGGKGTDSLVLDADYYMFFTANMLAHIENIVVARGHDYTLHLIGANVDSGGLTVDGSALHHGNSLKVVMDRGSAGIGATGGDGNDTFKGADGADTFDGANGDDFLQGGGNVDFLTGGLGEDVFVYNSAVDSRALHYDRIIDFDSTADKIALPYAVTGVDPAVATGTLSVANFLAELTTAVTGSLGPHEAVLFLPDAGDLAGRGYLVIDANDRAGYQAGSDYVIAFIRTTGLSDFGVDDFMLLT